MLKDIKSTYEHYLLSVSGERRIALSRTVLTT
jgi:hypothetical protein